MKHDLVRLRHAPAGKGDQSSHVAPPKDSLGLSADALLSTKKV